jgi:hypothetical protein
MSKFNLSEAAKEILDASVSSKRGAQDGTKKLPTSVVTGMQDAGKIGDSPEEETDDLPDYTKGTPSAKPPGATPPVGAQKDGVGAAKPAGQPQETQGRADLKVATQSPATDYAAIRDRIAGKKAAQTMTPNPGAHFQSYGESFDMSADVDALLEGENLSEEFRTKATTIFEAAVMSRAQVVVEEVEAQLTEQFEMVVEQAKEELSEQVNDYLNYFVEEWMKENEIALEKGLRSEITEDFMTGLRDLFIEHHIDIPEDKVNVVEEFAAKIEELENSLNEQINTNIELSKSLNEQKKIEALHTVCEGLTQTQVEKLKSLAESVEFTTESEFMTKLETLVESYFKPAYQATATNGMDEEVLIEEETKKKVSYDKSIESYAQTISKTLIK